MSEYAGQYDGIRAAERVKVIEECARAACPWCEGGDIPTWDTATEDWRHPCKYDYRCMASELHDLLAEAKEGAK